MSQFFSGPKHRTKIWTICTKIWYNELFTCSPGQAVPHLSMDLLARLGIGFFIGALCHLAGSPFWLGIFVAVSLFVFIDAIWTLDNQDKL